MEFRNLTPFAALCFSALDTRGNDYPVVVMKVGYRLQPIPGQPGHCSAEVMADEPILLCAADRYFGEQGQSSVYEESDLAPFKPRCDVIINGHAHAPGGEPTTSWTAGIRLSAPLSEQPCTAQHEAEHHEARGILLDKHLRFSGPRHFEHGLFSGWRLSAAEPAIRVPLRWEYAFGGSSVLPNPDYPDNCAEPYLLHQVCYSNPLGRGWIEKRHEKHAWSMDAPLQRLAAPQIEALDRPVTHLHVTHHPDGDISAADMAQLSATYGYCPAGFGVVGRAWAPRLALAGTYDKAWQKKPWPGLPADFDFAYWNAAPVDQQIAFLPANLRIELFNLTPPALSHNGQLCVELPEHRPFVLMRLHSGELLPLPLFTDTLHIDTDAMTLSLTHRISLPRPDDICALEACFDFAPCPRS
ncbi:hypothetical protein D3C76_852670 [compost metagenome]|uniref:DUF2169 family type VI secretion system accessory protein n=1 Tax=Pseudomonas TaxID=286 RepID=UPI000FB33938|nr:MULTISPECIES: DUF2169 domain-containing protein [Pseudomonas]MCE5983559.1 DUF2169 domain-containing protein [Pseudomonas sp. LF19]UVM24158.1 DUF2169 domain-containing protein [Pseudomonas wadenswilerensis]SPO67209.1 conserved protein of unknown function [Pseudomonas sp. JV241A]